MLKVTHKMLIETALDEVETLDVDDAVPMLEDAESLFIDIRDPRELEREGKIPGAVHAPPRHARILGRSNLTVL